MLCFWGPDLLSSWTRGSSAGAVESREHMFAGSVFGLWLLPLQL